jgi:DNA-directed RNA polymerase specialized sigma subunit
MENENLVTDARFFHDKGYSIKQIAKMFGVSEDYVSEVVTDITERLESVSNE